MNSRLHTSADIEDAIFTRQEVLATGLCDKDIQRLLRRKEWIRVRPGAYVAASVWSAATPTDRHRIHSIAVLRSLGPTVALSHTSAAIMHGFATWRAPLAKVQVTRLDGGSGRIERDLAHHTGSLDPTDVVDLRGHLATGPVRTVLDCTQVLSLERALVVADSALHGGACSREELVHALELRHRWPGHRRGLVLTRLADGRAASPGETRVRFLCHQFGLPMPELQYEVWQEGSLVGIADFAWPELGLLGEFDGKIKYGALLKPGQSATDVVVAEKLREDRLREVTGFRMVRITWNDLDDAARLAQRLRVALGLRST